MELQQLRYFKAVAETGKISAAAESLYLSAPALSAAIARLEKDLGMPLFTRTNNRILLNRQGEIFLRYVNQVFSTLDCARAELRQSLVQQGQHVSVATLNSQTWVDLLTAFSQEYPRFATFCANFRREHLAASGLPHQHSFLLGAQEDVVGLSLNLESLPLFRDQMAILVHPDHPLAGKAAVEAGDLLRQTLLFPLEGSALFERACGLFEQAGLPVPLGRAYSYLVYRNMVAQGMGVAFTTLHCSRSENRDLCCVPVEGPGSALHMELSWARGHALTADERCFRDFVVRFYGA